MATTNVSLNPSGWTYTNSWKPTTNYAFQNPIEICGSSFSLHGESKVVLQFEIPSSISSTKINSCILNFDIQALWDSSQTPSSDLTLTYPMYYSGAIANGYVYSAITHSNYSTLISQSTKTQFKSFSGERHYNSNQVDITSVVANNINNNVLTIVLEGMQSYQSQQINASSISLAISYEAVEPVAPVITAPNGTYENRSNDIKFEWSYKSQTEATQASATLEYRKGTNGAYTSINVYSSNNYYVMVANTLSEGVYEWRIKTTDTDGKTSGYAYGSFTVIDRPGVPIITNIENKCISTITWSSADQIAFEFEVYRGNDVEFSKKVSSSANNYKPNIFFANTSYTIRLRVCNLYGLWSEWGSKIFTFTFTNPSKPTIIVSPRNHEVVIKSNTIGAIVYKSENNSSYIPIGKIMDNGSFIDYNVANSKLYRYFVRSYVDGYTDSDIQLAQVTIKGVVLQSDTSYIKLRLSQNSYMDYSKTVQTEKVIKKYSGRQYGVAEFGEFREKAIDLSTTVTQDELETLENLYYSNEVLVYRDFRSNKFYCVIENLNITQVTMKYYNVELTVQQIDNTEEVSIFE